MGDVVSRCFDSGGYGRCFVSTALSMLCDRSMLVRYYHVCCAVTQHHDSGLDGGPLGQSHGLEP